LYRRSLSKEKKDETRDKKRKVGQKKPYLLADVKLLIIDCWKR
jgi:hypothetical protein